MPFFVYGIDSKTGALASRYFGDAATEAEARQMAERRGLRVNTVVPSRSTSAIVLPDHPPPQPTAEEMKAVAGEEFAAFNHTLKGITPHVYVTYGVVGANALVFILRALFGANVIDPSSVDLLRWGAEYAPRANVM